MGDDRHRVPEGSSARMEHAAYGRYPLLIKIPRAEMHGSTVGFRHTEYIIEVDDCGKVYTRSRRYTMFAWLHAELRHRELACALPELPPKKVLGNRESAFVERRKQMLEDYLKALLMLPAVIQDGMIWAFLDADEATAVVPRFLCRPATHQAAEKCLSALKRAVAEKQGEVFRLCDATVLEELSQAARAEAAEPVVMGQQMQVRLKNRSKLCYILFQVICYDRARHKLVQSDVLGALLALLCRAAEDEVELGAGADQHNSFWATKCVKSLIQETNGEALLFFCQQEGAVNSLRALATAQVEALHSVCAWVLWFGLRCPGVVTALAGAGGTRGLFLLGDLLKSPELCARVLARLCIGWIVRQEGALDTDAREYCLQALAPLCAELDTVELLAIRKALESGSKEKSFSPVKIIQRDELWDCDLWSFLDGRSLDAFDLRDRHGQVIPLAKHAPEADQFPLQMVLREEAGTGGAAGASAVSLAELARTERGSVASLERRGSAGTLAPGVPGSSENLEAPSVEKLELLRDPALVKMLTEVCGRKELSRLQVLLTPPEDGELDTVTACVVAILDHYVLQSEEKEGQEPDVQAKRGSKVTFRELVAGAQARPEARLPELQPLIPALERLVKAPCEGMVRGGVGGAAADEAPNAQVSVEEVRVRAARILVRIKGALVGAAEAAAGSSSLIDLGSRAHILEVLMRDSENSQANALDRVAQTREKCETQRAHIVSGALCEDPCVREKDLQAFKQKLRDLTQGRNILRYEVDNLKEDLEAMEVRLQQRCIKHGLLARDVQELCLDVDQKEGEFSGCAEVLSELQQCEAQHQQHLGQVEQLKARLREAEAQVEGSSKKEAEAKAKAEALRKQEAEWTEFCHTAPAKLERCQCRLVDVSQQRQSLGKRRVELATEVDRSLLRRRALEEQLTEVEHALKVCGAVGRELEALKPDISSELIMTDAEVDKLKALAAKLQPAKPARLRRSSFSVAASSSGEVEETPLDHEAWCLDHAPQWDDVGEQDFQQNLHFRALRNWRDQRERLWMEEDRWLKETLQRADESATKLREQCNEAETLERQMTSEEDELQKELGTLNDPEGHSKRLMDARVASAAALHEHEELHTAWAEASGAKELVKEQLKQAEEDVTEVLPRLKAAQARATDNEEATKKVRQELQARFQDLEKRAREFLQEWRTLEKKEQSLVLRQDRVDQSLRNEADGRQGLRAEVHQLIDMLQLLDRQLLQPEAK
ncbi:unnamed protein product [Durusdinium trenchii]|uniref:PX domain-containing protein n=1 Tax=Durusdinium trenchii TaxID=1381693 RepID=A0ABP0J917_9DINO